MKVQEGHIPAYLVVPTAAGRMAPRRLYASVWLEYLKYRILPKVLQLGFPAAPSGTGSEGLQPWL